MVLRGFVALAELCVGEAADVDVGHGLVGAVLQHRDALLTKTVKDNIKGASVHVAYVTCLCVCLCLCLCLFLCLFLCICL